MRTLLASALFAAACFGQSVPDSISSYSLQSGAHAVGWHKQVYDPVSGYIVDMQQDWTVNSTIFVSALYATRMTDLSWIKIGSSGSGAGDTVSTSGTAVTRTSGMNFNASWIGALLEVNTTQFTVASVTDASHLAVTSGSPGNGQPYFMNCPDPTNWFGDRHFVAYVAVDTTRGRLYQFGGKCAPAGGGSHNRSDTWYLGLNVAPASGTYNLVSTAHHPDATNPIQGAMEYDPDHDIIFLYGSDGGAETEDNWIYCPTTSGTLSSKQLALGICKISGVNTPDDWIKINPTGPGGSCNGGDSSTRCFPGTRSQGMVYDASIQKFIAFSGLGTAGQSSATYSFDLATLTWTDLSPSGSPPVNTASLSRFPCTAYAGNGFTYLYDPATGHWWVYDSGGNTWTDLGALSSGPSSSEGMAYDSVNKAFYLTTTDTTVAWRFQMPLPPTITTSSPLPAGYKTVAYSTTLAATGTGTITWSVGAGLPTGLTLHTGTGVIDGTPSGTPGTASFTIGATNGVTPDASVPFNLTINPACTISTTSLPNGQQNVTYSQTVATSNCVSPTFSITSGSLGPLSLNASSGAITGTPVSTSTLSFTVGVTDAAGTPTQALTIAVDPGPTIQPVSSGGVLRSVIH